MIKRVIELFDRNNDQIIYQTSDSSSSIASISLILAKLLKLCAEQKFHVGGHGNQIVLSLSKCFKCSE